MQTVSGYWEKLPGTIRIIGQYITEHADDLAERLEGTKDYKLTISLKPGDGDTIFEPTITAEHTAVVIPAFRYYYGLDGIKAGVLSEEEAKG